MKKLFVEWLEARDKQFLILEDSRFPEGLVKRALDNDQEALNILLTKTRNYAKKILRSKIIGDLQAVEDLANEVVYIAYQGLLADKIESDKYREWLNGVMKNEYKKWAHRRKRTQTGWEEPGTGRGGGEREGPSAGFTLEPVRIWGSQELDVEEEEDRPTVRDLMNAIEELEKSPKIPDILTAKVFRLRMEPDPDDPDKTYSLENIAKELNKIPGARAGGEVTVSRVGNYIIRGKEKLKKIIKRNRAARELGVHKEYIDYLVEYYFPT